MRAVYLRDTESLTGTKPRAIRRPANYLEHWLLGLVIRFGRRRRRERFPGVMVQGYSLAGIKAYRYERPVRP